MPFFWTVKSKDVKNGWIIKGVSNNMHWLLLFIYLFWSWSTFSFFNIVYRLCKIIFLTLVFFFFLKTAIFSIQELPQTFRSVLWDHVNQLAIMIVSKPQNDKPLAQYFTHAVPCCCGNNANHFPRNLSLFSGFSWTVANLGMEAAGTSSVYSRKCIRIHT